jgi:putative nucleotidyltransferase with HDIG domain
VEGQSFFSKKRTTGDHPKEMIQQSMKRKEVIEKAETPFITIFCFPIQTIRRVYGGLWLNLSNAEQTREKIIPEITSLVSQAAIALERSILLKESREKAEQISLAYYQLQTTYDQTLMALVSAIDLRDRETEGHSIRVAQLAVAIGMELNLSPDDLKSLERGALLHDIGKIGISDDILHKPEQLTLEEWKIMHQHPKIGMQIVESIPFLKAAVTVVANHQERWDGSGYPKGLKGKDIPILARIFAVADVFDALISDRPYHEKVSPQDAVEYLKFQANILFDPDVIKAFLTLYERPSFLKQLGFYEL